MTMTTPQGSVEKWNVHFKCQEFSQLFIELWPLLQKLNSQYPTDITYIDFSRIQHCFDPNSKRLDPKKVNNQHPFWTEDNPFPINSISSDEEILSIWDRKPPGSQNLIFTQLKSEVALMIAMKNQKPSETMLVVGHYIKEVRIEGKEKVQYPSVVVCFMIRKVKVKPTPDEPVEDQIVLSVEPTMIFT